jgi:tRNA pseudouridine38-40 synthase
VRPAVEAGAVGWSFRPLDGAAMQAAARLLIGEHDFSAFRSAECQAASAVKTMRSVGISKRGAYWRFEFDASAFLHHMVRNLMGCLVAVGSGAHSASWLAEVLALRERRLAAATFSADGLYFIGPYYDAIHAIPDRSAAMDWLP